MFELKYEFDWSIPFTEPYLHWIIVGIKITLLFAVVTTITSLCLGTVLAVMRLSRSRSLRFISRGYVEITRNIPGLFWLLFFYFIFPEILPFDWGAKLNAYRNYPILAGIIGLTVDNASYVSDILRSGRLAIPNTQREVAISTGLNRVQQYLYVLLPQMYRVVLPPLGTRMIHNFKNTSLCMAISAPELTWATQQIESITFRGLEATTIATLFYLLLSMCMVAVIILLEKYYKVDISSIAHTKG